MRIRVYFEDTDCGQIVYHTNYIKYCERARSELFFSQNSLPFEGNCGFVLSSLNAKFVAPARLGDLLEVRSKVLKMRQSSLLIEQQIYRIHSAIDGSSEEILIFSMEALLAFVDTALQKPLKIPPRFLEVLKSLD
ncbi:4-hydroxybenzoyl-CoA thioesterase [Helicobacter sp. MIT 00-7814]|uniref:YbgC/FadM family acyl-CoA thioesterase n=1 Tax=unclassified Helicobacter TaxID=2593540 RepID=UPI000E1F7469|nr:MULTISPECIES: YbgC/FadM family acyl-CoA thioesterase [unclassified Helicobacter]RDU52073.1 4-hydroxybenzoyl-CoA thioesterase [Helicobacter sp. MIT 00-7814]RDU52079.1 4-hydroxybenzoyl-CoA thioesterase [Helicobacter sp. MIT 99-10781]